MPYAIVISLMCILDMTSFITSTGHGAPAMIPRRRDETSYCLNSGWLSCAMNIVGTPYRTSHFSAWMALSVVPGSNDSPG